MPRLKMQVASKISSDSTLNLLELEENFGLWKGMKSMDVQSLLTSRILQHSVSMLILRTASSLQPPLELQFSSVPSKLLSVFSFVMLNLPIKL